MEKMISLIMVNYNGIKYMGEEDLYTAINSFLKTDYKNFEFILVDNNSDDNSIPYIRNVFDNKNTNIETTIVRNTKNLGFAGGCNEGIKQTKGDYICLVNNDDKALNTYWMKNLVTILESDIKIGAVFAKKLKWDNEEIIDAAGNEMNPTGLVTQTGDGEIDNGQYNEIRESLIWQTPVLFRKEIIDKIGGLFDDDYIILNDDTDSSIRIWMAGYKIIYVPISVAHKRSITMKHLPIEFVAFHGRKNTIQTLIKNYELRNLIRWVPITIFIYSAAVFYYLFIKRPDQSKATLKAIFWNFFHIRHIIKKRYIVQKTVRKIEDKEIMKYMTPFNIKEIIFGDKVWPK